MNLTPLYELRDRLKAGAIAGTGLLSDDFRLQRAVEGLAPLEAASPVFAKLGKLARSVLEPECTDRASKLLDALALTDAVLCTQAITTVSEPLTPLPRLATGRIVANAPYSVLSPLLEALTTSGGGRYSYILDTHKSYPELFQDYRVKNAMVTALGAPYAELAEQVAQWLSQEDESLLPLLERGFDPKGKREMVRRVQVIEAVAGKKENRFYLEMLEDAEKEVRAALIYALRLSEENAEKLVALCKTEKGNCKKMAHWAVACLKTPVAWEYWQAYLAKKSEQAYLAYSTIPQAEELTITALLSLLAPFESDPLAPLTRATANQLQELLYALPGKTGSLTCKFYRHAAALGNALDRPVEGEKEALHLQVTPYDRQSNARIFSEVLPALLHHQLVLDATPELLALARELGTHYGVSYAAPHLAALLLDAPAGESAALADALLNHQKRRACESAYAAVEFVLNYINWDTEGYTMTLHYVHPARDNIMQKSVQPLHEPLDHAWFTLLMRSGKFDKVMDQFFPREDAALCQELGEYYYQKALIVEDNKPYLQYLKHCKWQKCDGLLESYCKHQPNVKVLHMGAWLINDHIGNLPGSPAAKADEVERVLDLIDAGDIKMRTWNPTNLRLWVQQQRAQQGNGEIL